MPEQLIIPVEIRSADDPGAPPRLAGTLLTYGEVARDRREYFDPGALYWPESGFNVNEQHERKSAFVRVLPYLDGGAVKIDTPLPDTARARDAATNLREGVYTGLSLEFNAERETRRAGFRVIQRAKVVAAGLVDLSSYAGSTAEIREVAGADAPEVWHWL